MGLEDEGYRVAYSNEAFELWYILHFEYLNTALSRTQYKDKLTAYFGEEYKKNNPLNFHIIQEKGSEKLATQNAINLRRANQKDEEYKPPAGRNPETTVDELVCELRKYYRE